MNANPIEALSQQNKNLRLELERLRRLLDPQRLYKDMTISISCMECANESKSSCPPAEERNIDSLQQENYLLQSQVDQIKYFLDGTHAFKSRVIDFEPEQHIYCGKEEIHQIAAGLLSASMTCADIGPGLRPQRMLDCPVHILVEPWRPYAERLVGTYPGKVVVTSFATPYLSTMFDRSIDTIFLLDVIEHIEKEEGRALLREACRVARVQVVLFTPLGFMPHEVHDTPLEWGDVEHGTTQKHLSGWTPEEISGASHVICENYHTSKYGTYGAFYSIIPIHPEQSLKPRLILISEELPQSFELAQTDIFVVDVQFNELSHVINTIPKHNTLVVPLQLIAEQPGVPVEALYRTMINMPVLMQHLEQFDRVEAFGTAAQAVFSRLRKHLDKSA